MVKLTMKWKSRICVWVLVLFLFLSMGLTGALASSDSENQITGFKPFILHSVAYYEAVCGPPEIANEGKNYNQKLEEKLLNLSDEELKELVKEHLLSVIERKKQGESLVWDKEFVEQIVKTYLPDLYPVITEQMGQDSGPGILIDGRREEPIHLNYTPGNKTKNYVVYGKHWTGYNLWGFWCRMYWAWDSTKITTVLPSTWGEIYDPTWVYDGIAAHEERFINPQSYFKWVKGQFHNYVPQNRYPWHEITVYAGRTDSWRSGIDGGV